MLYFNDYEQRCKMDPKSDQGIILGYSINNRAYRVYNSQSKTIMESINMVKDVVPQTLMSEKEEDYIHKNEQNGTTKVSKKHYDILQNYETKV